MAKGWSIVGKDLLSEVGVAPLPLARARPCIFECLCCRAPK